MYRKRQGDPVGRAEQSQHHSPQCLKQQIPRRQPQEQSRAAHRQIFQKKQPGHLTVLQPDQNIGAQLPAAAGEHEAGGIGDQPAGDEHCGRAGQDDHQGQRSQFFRQIGDLPGKDQTVEGIDQSGGHHNGDEIHQIVPCLPPGVAPGKLI